MTPAGVLSDTELPANSGFGYSVSLYEGFDVFEPELIPPVTLATGAPGTVGSVYVYYAEDATNPVWDLQGTLNGPAGSSNYGVAVSVHSDTLVKAL